ncbi:MAG: NPCBM/NEW2 domain-containing protein [Armatimonadota bacterium]
MNSPMIKILMISVMAGIVISSAGAEESTAVFEQKGASLAVKNSDMSMLVSMKSPVFAFDGSTVGGTEAVSSIEDDILSGQTVSVQYKPILIKEGYDLKATLKLKWSAKESILRKWAVFSITGNDPILLNEVTLDTIGIKGTKVWTHGDLSVIDDAVQSHPIFIPGFFTGIEFPVSAARIENGNIILGHRPGAWIVPGKQYETRKAIYGIAPKGEEIGVFENYIEMHRPKPQGLHINYNSWWTSPVPFSEKDIAGLMGAFETNMYKPYKASFDTFCIDLGWSDPNSIWEINKKLFPEEFKGIQAAARKMDSNLGLWISPSNCYSPASIDNKWAVEHGYEASMTGDTPAVLCLGGKKYSTQFRNRLVDMITKYGIRHVKLDGIWLTCDTPGHGHEIGLRSSEKIAEGFISACEGMRKAASDVWLEPTCFGYNPSPWWLFYVNSVIGTFGDDAPMGRVPCPVSRESYTTARDYFNLQGASLLPFPIAAQEVLGIVHQSKDPFMNDAVTSILRGHMFQPVYMNPKFMNDARWKSFAELLKWARKNSGILQSTRPLLPMTWLKRKTPHFTDGATMPREPYGFAHCKGSRGLIMLRNPWIAKTSYTVKLDKSIGLSPGSKSFSGVSIYPEARSYFQNLKYGDSVDIQLAPYETIVISLNPGTPKIKALPVSESVGNLINATITKQEFTRINFKENMANSANSTSPMADDQSAIRMNLDAEVTSGAADNQLLVLLEAEKSPIRSDCKIIVNGKDAVVEYLASAASWSATGLSAPEHWMFIKTVIPRGKSNLSIKLLAGNECRRISAWVWSTKPGVEASYPNAIPAPELVSLDSYALLKDTSIGGLNLPEIEEVKAVERINGIYLDSLDPVSAMQGWGRLQRNLSVWEKPLIIAGKQYTRGLGTHAASEIEYALDGKYKRFQVDAGVDGGNGGTVTFEIWVDSVKKWESGYMVNSDPAKKVDLDITGAQKLLLVVGDGGNGIGSDHADWCDAKLLF